VRGTWLLVSFRFFYGLRNAVPFAAGMAGITARRFLPLNAIGAALWAPAIAMLGYAFGRATESILEHAQRYEAAIFLALAASGVLLYLWRHRRH
jgi:membrane protein DedA with SNARE-associated domain